MKKCAIFFGLLLATSFGISAQDPQFSQFYAAPIYQNPAFAGGAYAPRLIANYRNQWPSLNANYVTSAVSFDHYIERFNSGVGIILVNDSQGPGRLKSTDIGTVYSYQLKLSEDAYLRLGAQATFSSKNLNYLGLTFGDQYDNKGFLGTPSNDPFANQTNLQTKSNIDFSGGVLFYNPKYWLGFATHHLNQPSFSFLKDGIIPSATVSDAIIPRKVSLSGGMKIELPNPFSSARNLNNEFSVSPTFTYKRQGKFEQLDLGFYATYASLTAGLWYRGIPLKKVGNTRTNHDALVFLLGYRQDNFSIGYSYDLTISGLGASSGGSHEISIAYQLEKIESKVMNKRRRKGELSCPKY